MTTTYAEILNTVIDNGRITAQSPEDFQAQLKSEVEFEASEQGLSGEEVKEAVEFALTHASF